MTCEHHSYHNQLPDSAATEQHQHHQHQQYHQQQSEQQQPQWQPQSSDTMRPIPVTARRLSSPHQIPESVASSVDFDSNGDAVPKTVAQRKRDSLLRDPDEYRAIIQRAELRLNDPSFDVSQPDDTHTAAETPSSTPPRQIMRTRRPSPIEIPATPDLQTSSAAPEPLFTPSSSSEQPDSVQCSDEWNHALPLPSSPKYPPPALAMDTSPPELHHMSRFLYASQPTQTYSQLAWINTTQSASIQRPALATPSVIPQPISPVRPGSPHPFAARILPHSPRQDQYQHQHQPISPLRTEAKSTKPARRSSLYKEHSPPAFGSNRRIILEPSAAASTINEDEPVSLDSVKYKRTATYSIASASTAASESEPPQSIVSNSSRRSRTVSIGTTPSRSHGNFSTSRSLGGHRYSVSGCGTLSTASSYDMFGGGSLVGSFEESILSGRMSTPRSHPIYFVAQIGVLGLGTDCKPSLRCPRHVQLQFPAHFYHHPEHEAEQPPLPYVGIIDLQNNTPIENDAATPSAQSVSNENTHSYVMSSGNNSSVTSGLQSALMHSPVSSTNSPAAKRIRHQEPQPNIPASSPNNSSTANWIGAYRVPPKGQLQIVVRNPNRTAVKLFLVPYDLSDMPPMTKTFLRQKSYGPSDGTSALIQHLHSSNSTPSPSPASFGSPFRYISGGGASSIKAVDEADFIMASLNEAAAGSNNSSSDRSTLRYAVHLQFICTSKRRIYLYNSIRVVFSHRVPDTSQKLRVVCEDPGKPKYIPIASVPSNLEPQSSVSRLTKDGVRSRRAVKATEKAMGQMAVSTTILSPPSVPIAKTTSPPPSQPATLPSGPSIPISKAPSITDVSLVAATGTTAQPQFVRLISTSRAPSLTGSPAISNGAELLAQDDLFTSGPVTVSASIATSSTESLRNLAAYHQIITKSPSNSSNAHSLRPSPTQSPSPVY
ncbi:hypothetical protein GQ42DRAFT_160246 [Ramicandelaber brevisporus]|nr:hypothetical protein GQ42DRAFT_160246 [Ramicandelaber brevisporus]